MDTNKLNTYYFIAIDKNGNKTVIGMQAENRETAFIFLADFYKEDRIEYM